MKYLGEQETAVRDYIKHYDQLGEATDRIDEVAKKLAALAPVDSYSVNTMHKGQPSPAREVRERIDALSAEMEANKEALKKMPIARALYASKLDRLKRALENLGDAEDMMFNISVTMDDR